MQRMFKIVSKGIPVKIEMSSSELDLAVRIGRYINDNFDASDFSTITNIQQRELLELVTELESSNIPPQQSVEIVSLNLSQDEYKVFEEIFIYGRSFLDDTADFEPEYDEIEMIADVISPPTYV